MPEAEHLVAQIESLLPDFLPQQRWFGSSEPPVKVTVTSTDVWREEPLLLWMVVEVHPAGADSPATSYQLLLGGRPVDVDEKFMKGKERVTVGVVDGLVVYDALVDPELALDVLGQVAPDEEADMARPLLVEQSNTSVVYDERLILKLFRQLHPGPNPDVEVNRVLADRGFPHVVPQRAELKWDGMDLAVVRDYLLGATDAWKLALTSLRDLLGSRLAPEESGGDFAAEATYLGEATAQLHVALADAFGVQAPDPEEWLDAMRAQVARVPEMSGGLDRSRAVAALEGRMRQVGAGGGEAEGSEVAALVEDRAAGGGGGASSAAGAAIRIHGDLHLGQFLRSDSGWFVLDFEGEPDRPMAERMHPSSPLRDVAGVRRSFHYASRAVLVERGRDIDPELAELADAWENRASEAFWGGYLGVPGVTDLLPQQVMARDALLGAFELDKAVYEIGYELAHRPSWVSIPASAIERLLVV